MIDILECEYLEIKIRVDGKVVWVNGVDRCLLRAGKIKELVVVDERSNTK